MRCSNKDGNETGKYEDTDDGVYINKGDTAPYVTKTADKPAAKVGDKLTYTVALGNAAGAVYEIENAAMTDVIPAGLDFVDGSVQVDGKTAVYSYDNETGTLSVPLDSIAPATEKTVTFSVTVNDAAYGKTVYNTAVLSGDNIPDTEGKDDGVSVGDGKARPSIEKTADKAAASVGDKITYTLTLSNSETATVPVQNAVVTDVLPDGLTFEYGSVMVDGSTTSSYTYEQASRLLTVNVGSIDPDTRRTVSFVATVNEDAYNTTIQNLATLTADNTEPVQDKDDGVVVADGRTDLSVVKTVDKSSAKVGDKLTYTVQVSNGAGAQVNIRDAAMQDTIPDGLTFYGNVTVDGYSAAYQYDNASGTLTVPLDTIAPGQTKTVCFDVLVNSNAYVNYATGAGDNGNATGQSPEIEIVSAVDEPVTDIHYQLFNGYGDGNWRPGDRISLQEACTVAYRLIANGGNTWLERGSVTVPDYEYTIPEEAKYFVSIGVLPASVFDTTQMTEDTDYEVNYDITENGYLRIWATAAQLNTLVKFVTGTNAGVSGDVSRLTFAKVICQLTGRDTSPDTTGYSGNVQYYPDVTSSVDLVTEVSHEHDYMLDADGNEYWI